MIGSRNSVSISTLEFCMNINIIKHSVGISDPEWIESSVRASDREFCEYMGSRGL